MDFNRIPFASRQLCGERRLSVLVADADPEVFCMLQQLTPPDHFRLLEVQGSEELMEHLRWLDVALVIVDVSIIRQSSDLREHLVFHVRLGRPLIVTAEGEPPADADEVLARSLGCVLYAPKPCGYWMLHQAVTKLLCEPVSNGKAPI